MKIFNYIKIHFLTLVICSLFSMLSQANETGLGVASNWGIDLQNPISEVAKDVYDMHFFVLIIITLITLFVLALLLWVCYRYSEKNNKNPSKTVHNTLIEILWTAIPVLILVVIAIPSFKLTLQTRCYSRTRPYY